MSTELEQLKRLHQELAEIIPDLVGKPALDENLVDMLEIVGVAAGIKPAHLNGQGLRSERILQDIERIASRYDLRILRTKKLRRYGLRHPAYDPDVYAWQRQQDEVERNAAEDVLWVYRDASLESAIHKTSNGEIDASFVLGYPPCCVRNHLEIGIRLGERLVEALQRVHGAKTANDVIELLKSDAQVSIEDIDLAGDMERSHELLPYVQFGACPGCLAHSQSPAAAINRNMRDLAFAIQRDFGRQIWIATYEIYCPERLRNLGRNDACPCGSGTKYKKCCG